MLRQFTFSQRFQKSFMALTIQGTDRLYESSINMDICVIWYFEDNATIILADVGHHDILKQF